MPTVDEWVTTLYTVRIFTLNDSSNKMIGNVNVLLYLYCEQPSFCVIIRQFFSLSPCFSRKLLRIAKAWATYTASAPIDPYAAPATDAWGGYTGSSSGQTAPAANDGWGGWGGGGATTAADTQQSWEDAEKMLGSKGSHLVSQNLAVAIGSRWELGVSGAIPVRKGGAMGSV